MTFPENSMCDIIIHFSLVSIGRRRGGGGVRSLYMYVMAGTDTSQQ